MTPDCRRMSDATSASTMEPIIEEVKLSGAEFEWKLQTAERQSESHKGAEETSNSTEDTSPTRTSTKEPYIQNDQSNVCEVVSSDSSKHSINERKGSKEAKCEAKEASEAGGYKRIALFTVNIVGGIIGSQVAYGIMPHDVYHVWYEFVSMMSLLCLSFIMINVGYEFAIDKTKLSSYGTDTLVAMTAAGFPWIFVACWFIWVLPTPLPWKEALVAARFAAPTSAGVLFCMLEAAGLKETWLFKKARILAIFDDLDTILFMVPLKGILIGLKWELFLILFIVFGLLIFGYKRLHAYRIPSGWRWTMLYAFAITVATEVVYFITKYHIAMEAIHIEVLLPAFILGAVAQIEHDEDDHEPDDQEERVLTWISALFMVFVGLSMPPLFGENSGDGESEPMSGGAFVGHVLGVSLLMVLGKMYPVLCYKKEANLRTRLALALGMCPRGEVGAGVILISLDLGIKGEAVGVAIVCLALNMVMTGGFIVSVKRLVTKWVPEKQGYSISQRLTHIWGRQEVAGGAFSKADAVVPIPHGSDPKPHVSHQVQAVPTPMGKRQFVSSNGAMLGESWSSPAILVVDQETKQLPGHVQHEDLEVSSP